VSCCDSGAAHKDCRAHENLPSRSVKVRSLQDEEKVRS
jgi:hypothetical protein